MQRSEQMTFWERIYIPEILRGLAITNYHFVRNLALHTAHLFGLKKDVNATSTTQYPEERKHYPDNFRGSNRLTRREDSGAVRDRHSAMHLLRALRRGVPVRRDSDGHLRASAHLGFRPQGFRRAEGTADASLAGVVRERPRRQHERDARVVPRAGRAGVRPA